ncbi:MAG: SPFH domain-containing protein, partial [Planctomycetota bacterium]
RRMLRQLRTRVVSGVLWTARLLQRTWRSEKRRRLTRWSGRALKISLAGGVLAALTLAVFHYGFDRIPPGVIAVKQSRMGDGVEPRDYGPGLHFSVPGVHLWHMLPDRMHYLSFASQPMESERPLLKVRTKDGNVARVEVTVPFRIREGEGHELVAEGLRTAYRTRVQARIEKVLLSELANLSSDDFADTDLRLERAGLTLDAMNEVLEPLHVRAESVQIHGVYFPSDYEEKLQAKQLLRQEANLEEARRLMNERTAEVERIETEIDLEERNLRAEAAKVTEELRAASRLSVVRIHRSSREEVGALEAKAFADADRARQAGEAAIDRANAERFGQFAAIYETRGGKLYLARQAAESLNIQAVTLDPRAEGTPLLFDPEAVVDLLTGKGVSD